MLRELCITEHSSELTYVRELTEEEASQYTDLAYGTRWCRITNLHHHGESVQRCKDWEKRIEQGLLHPLKVGSVVEAMVTHGDVIRR